MMKVGRILNWVLILAGMVEALWGLGQVYGYLPVKHAMFPLTGSFYNPGPYGGFLAMAFPVCLWEVLNHYRNCRKGLAYWISLVALVLIGIMLPATMSRTAWVAVAISSVYVCGSVYPTEIKSLGKRLSLKCKYWKVVVLLLLLAVGTAGYLMKKDSADGRLLMWKVSAQAVLEHPWTGVGWDQVPGAYGDAQEKYFASGEATAQEEHVAGSPEYVFNEYLQVAMARGVPALCGILMVVIVLFCLGHGNGRCLWRSAVFGSVCLFFLSVPVHGVHRDFHRAVGGLPDGSPAYMGASRCVGIGVRYQSLYIRKQAGTECPADVRACPCTSSGRGMASIDGLAEGNDENQQRCNDTEHHREELSRIGKVQGSGRLVYPFHPSFAEPHLSILLVGETVCGTS